MFQTFDEKTDPSQGRVNLPRLRKALGAAGLDGFIVPHEDEYQNEYLPPSAERLAWLTGFSGSAGAAAVLKDKAAVFVDGRYTLQVRAQVDTNIFEPVEFKAGAIAEWLSKNAGTGAKIGYDPRLHTIDAIDALREALTSKGLQLSAVSANPIDLSWEDRPAEPIAPVVPHPIAYAGEEAAAKREKLGKALSAARLDASIITSPASIAWLLNIRGGDVAHTPLPLARAILYPDGAVDLFIDRAKVSEGLEAHLGNAVVIRPPQEFSAALKGFAGKTIAADPMTAPASVFADLAEGKAKVKRRDDPCIRPRAEKNKTEIEGTREAHARDGAALARFFRWLASEGPKGGLTEVSVAEQLEAFRRATGALRDISFDTIPGAGANGAIVHYRPTLKTNKPVEPGTLMLIDSGAQYLDGTTDVTRTVAIGTPTEEMRRNFTLVLKGHISLAMARFPEGTCGVQLDILARQALWQAGLDYDHGTGHGVGSYLGVHEGPQNISKAPRNVPLLPGMILSNEPGYYKTGAYGIRIENLVLVTPPAPIAGGERMMLGFETLTLAPIDRTLIMPELLAIAERNWLNGYHARVVEKIVPRLAADERNWLEKACAPI